jgi:hypothetical protein
VREAVALLPMNAFLVSVHPGCGRGCGSLIEGRAESWVCWGKSIGLERWSIVAVAKVPSMQCRQPDDVPSGALGEIDEIDVSVGSTETGKHGLQSKSLES